MQDSTLELIMEKGPREGETLEFLSGTLVKIGRVVRGNTVGIKDAGISSKHICIQFDHESRKWSLYDLDSSNGTILNGKKLSPNVPFALDDGDCIKIGEITSIIVKIEVEDTSRLRRNPRRPGKAGSGAAAVVDSGIDEDLGKSVVEEPVEKRNLRSRAKKATDSKNKAESLSSRRTPRCSKKEENASFNPILDQIPEDLNVDEPNEDHFVALDDKKRQRGRKRKLPVKLPEDSNLDEIKAAEIVVPVEGKRTRGRNKLPVEPIEDVQNNDLENLQEIIEFVRNDAEDNLTSTQEGCKDADGSTLKRLSEEEVQVQVDVGKGKEVAEELEQRQDVCEDSVKNKGLDLENMTLGDYFDYLEVQLPKEIYDKTEKIISQLTDKAQKCHEFRLQANENNKG